MLLAHISTSLVGLVDAAVGGKTAINLPTGKNLVGLYKHPLIIVSDPAYLQHLPDTEYACGLAEAAKTAILAGEEFTQWMEQRAQQLAARDFDTLRELIARCISFKASIVASDPTEDNSPSARLSLNYGHTLGHVIETISAETALDTQSGQAMSVIPHGIAIAQGMRFEARMAMQLVDATPDFVLRQDSLLDALGLPGLDAAIMGDDLSHMIEIFYRDKKTQDNMLRFVLVSAPGQPEVVTVPREILADHLRAWIATAATTAQQSELAPRQDEEDDPADQFPQAKGAHAPADFSEFANYNPDTSPTSNRSKVEPEPDQSTSSEKIGSEQ
jgi:3-dehydroquinate synthase